MSPCRKCSLRRTFDVFSSPLRGRLRRKVMTAPLPRLIDETIGPNPCSPSSWYRRNSSIVGEEGHKGQHSHSSCSLALQVSVSNLNAGTIGWDELYATDRTSLKSVSRVGSLINSRDIWSKYSRARRTASLATSEHVSRSTEKWYASPALKQNCWVRSCPGTGSWGQSDLYNTL
jgi:hypothetical protein